MPTATTPNIAAQIARTLTVEILRGAHPVGSRMPTVRAMSQRFAVTPATIQRAVARLEMTGLVRVRQGSGITVRDAREVGGLGLVSAWLEASADCPDKAAALLADFLEVRRIVAARLLSRHRQTLVEQVPRLLAESTAFAEIDRTDVRAVCEFDLRFARTLLAWTGNTMALSVLNTAADVVRTVPHVAEAMYANPDENLAAYAELIQWLMHPEPVDLRDRFEALFAGIDATTVGRYEQRLRRAQ